MTTALAIFVKTPGWSPVKTRLAAVLGADRAVQFHRHAAAATASVVRACQPDVVPYWAVAEDDPAAWAAWPVFEHTQDSTLLSLHAAGGREGVLHTRGEHQSHPSPALPCKQEREPEPLLSESHLGQGQGDLGERLHQVYASLQARHGRVLLIGADAPQLTVALLRQAVAALADASFVLGDAADGGFWLFGGRLPIASVVWGGVRYSQPDTAWQLRQALAPVGQAASLPTLTDVDEATDLPALRDALAALSEPLPAQRTLVDWLDATLATMEPTA